MEQGTDYNILVMWIQMVIKNKLFEEFFIIAS